MFIGTDKVVIKFKPEILNLKPDFFQVNFVLLYLNYFFYRVLDIDHTQVFPEFIWVQLSERQHVWDNEAEEFGAWIEDGAALKDAPDALYQFCSAFFL